MLDNLISGTMTAMVEAALQDTECSSAQVGVEEGLDLKPTFVDVDSVDLSLVPKSLTDLFTFRSDLGVDPGSSFRASSVSIAIFPMRLDKEGNMVHASPSIKNAAYGKESKYLPLGEWGNRAVIKPDFYLEAELMTDVELDDFVIAIPQIYKQPYPVEGASVALSMSGANKTDDKFVEKHNDAREQFQVLMQRLSEELGVPAGEQFLVCLVGFPQSSRVISGENFECWGASFEGAFMLGGRRVMTPKSNLPASLSSLKVRGDFMVGGKDMKTRIAEEMLSYRKPQKRVAVPSKSVQTELVTSSVKESEPTVKSVPAKQVEPEFTMPSSGGILSQLSSLEDDSSDEEWEMIDMSEELLPVEPDLVTDPVLEVEVNEDLEVGKTKKFTNPFEVSTESEDLEVGKTKKFTNPFA